MHESTNGSTSGATQSTPHARPHVVIVGAGFGGLRAARTLGSAPVRVTLIDRNNYHLFQPLLYQVATAGLSPADISQPIRSLVRHQANTEVVLAEVTGVDVSGRRVLVRDASTTPGSTMPERAIRYDYLILATGANDSYFGHDEWEQYAPGLKSIPEATEIRRRLLLAFEAAEAEMETNPDEARALLTFVIVGGGATGVEMAGAIAEVARKSLVSDFRHINPASARVVLVEALPHLLGAYPTSLARSAAEKLRHLGVEVRVNTRVEQVDADGVVINGERLSARTVLWAAGVQASPAGRWIGAEMDRAGRVYVQPDLTVPSHPEILVVGDTAHLEINKKMLPGVAQVALQEGEYAASVIRARAEGRTRPAPFRYIDKGSLATVGRSFAIADIQGIHVSGRLAWLAWLGIHIFFLIGFRNRVLVLFQWAWAYLTYQRGARLIVTNRTEPVHTPTPTASSR